MRLPRRFSIAGLMAVVLVASLALVALRSGSATWAGGLYLLTHGVFVLAVVGAICRGPSERAWWLGFALFGLGYLRLDVGSDYVPLKLPVTALLEAIRPEYLRPRSPTFGAPPSSSFYYGVVGHSLFSLLAATIGGGLAHALFAVPASPPADRDAGPHREGRSARTRWRRVAGIGLAGLVTIAALVVAGFRPALALWAGAVYFLTWVVLGFAALGFACGRGRRRMICLGAALFGLGYMVLNRGYEGYNEYNYVNLVTERFLDALRPWLPPIESGYPAETASIAAANARITKALAQPVPMSFPYKAPLEDVLTYIRAATREPDGHEIPIYVDPVGLKESEKTMQSPIQIDLTGFPLKTTLRLALKQLGLVYYVRDGMLFINSESSDDEPVVVDYYLLLGHCVLALLTAGLGAWLVPLVADRRAGQPA